MADQVWAPKIHGSKGDEAHHRPCAGVHSSGAAHQPDVRAGERRAAQRCRDLGDASSDRAVPEVVLSAGEGVRRIAGAGPRCSGHAGGKWQGVLRQAPSHLFVVVGDRGSGRGPRWGRQAGPPPLPGLPLPGLLLPGQRERGLDLQRWQLGLQRGLQLRLPVPQGVVGRWHP